MSSNIAIIILAAGASRRMGQPKQLLEFQGETLMARICRTALSTECQPVVVVLGANANLIRKEIPDPGLLIVENPNWEKGMGTSLSIGINQLLETTPEVQAAIFILVDQPLVSSQLLEEIVATYQKSDKPIVACTYGEVIGVPALIDRSYFDRLQNIEADRGARFLIKQALNQVEKIPFPAGALDIDRPEEWERFIKEYDG